MLKVILNLLLTLVLGSLKAVLLRSIEKIDAEALTNEDKRKAVFESIKKDALLSGKQLSDNIINLAIEAGVRLLREKLGQV